MGTDNIKLDEKMNEENNYNQEYDANQNADESAFAEEKYYRCIDGLYRKNKIIGYCRCDVHIGALTTKLLKQHECLIKQCPFLVRFKEHSFWTEREKQKNLAKSRRKSKYTREYGTDSILEKYTRRAKEFVESIPNMKIRKVEHYGCGVRLWVYTPDLRNFKSISEHLTTAMGITVVLRRVDLSYADSIKALGDKFKPETKREKRKLRMDAIRKHSTDNQPDIVASEICGCYSCMNMFSPEEIKDYAPGYVFATAKCPVCGRKTVLPEHPDYKLTRHLLNELRQHYFKPKQTTEKSVQYIGNTVTKKFHQPGCRYSGVKNSVAFDSYEQAVSCGYTACKICFKNVL